MLYKTERFFACAAPLLWHNNCERKKLWKTGQERQPL